MKKILPITIIFLSSVTHAQQVFQFRSPSFNGINYSAHVQTIENTEKTRKDSIEAARLQAAKEAAAAANNTNLVKFLNNFESRVYAQLSTQLVNSLFGENPKDKGIVTIEGNTISYLKTGEELRLTVAGKDGSFTEIIIPIGQFKF